MEKIKNKKGVTLVELLVVVGIISLLSAIFLINYRAGERQFALQRSAYKVAQDLRRVEEMAMSAHEFQGAVPPGGYGIYFDEPNHPNYYFLFADLDNTPVDGPPPNHLYDYGGNPFNPTYDKLVEVIEFEKGVQISELYLGEQIANQLYIVFVPPDPTIFINSYKYEWWEDLSEAWGVDFLPPKIEIDLSENGFAKKVEVLATGLINIK